MDELKPGVYKDEKWRLFIDSFKRSLKGVLLQNTNNFSPIPIAHSTVLKETHQNVKFVLQRSNIQNLSGKFARNWKF